jgi:hypothetical protein
VTTGVQASSAVGKIPLTPEPSSNGASTGPASLTGAAQTGGAAGGVSEIVTLSALQPVTINGSKVSVTIPLVQQSVATANITTVSSASCTGLDCANFTLAVPGVNPFVGTFSTSGTKYAQVGGTTMYSVDAQPVALSDGTPVCSQTEQQSSPVAVSPGNSFPVGTFTFTGCS